MNVKLIALTQPVPWLQAEGIKTAEDLLGYEARVSNPSNQLNTGTMDKLFNHMIGNKHWSPFDMVNMTLEVTTSKAISIQILRHHSIKVQEFSQRYAEVTDIEPIQIRKQAVKNRQSSEEEFDPFIEVDCGNDMVKDKSSLAIEDHIEYSKNLYKALLKEGVAKECARMVLPMATSTTLYLNGSVRSWIHYMEQRCDHHAQLEHQEVANLIKDIFMDNFPMVSLALGLTK